MFSRKSIDLGIWTALAVSLALIPAAHAAPATAAAAAPKAVEGTTLLHIFHKGGPIMWPLLLASVISVTVAIERVIFLVGERNRRNQIQLNDLFVEVGRGNVEGAVSLARASQDPVVSTLGYALEHRDQSLPHALSVAETRTMKRYRRGIGVLDTIITLAPLLGLLGTVTGMMGSFSMIGGEVGAPTAITGGIAEALIATAFGLCIAIGSLLPFNWLNNCLERLETDLREAGDHLKQLLEGHRGAPLRDCGSASCRTCGAPVAEDAPESLRLSVQAAGGR